MDINLPPRDLGPEDGPLRQLRSSLVHGLRGNLTDIPLKLHYNNMRRISRQKFDYYFAPLEETAFSIGVALPSTYGKFFLKVDDEINKNKHMGTNITAFFQGKNWKIHPKWLDKHFCFVIDPINFTFTGCTVVIIIWKVMNLIHRRRNFTTLLKKSIMTISILCGECNMRRTEIARKV